MFYLLNLKGALWIFITKVIFIYSVLVANVCVYCDGVSEHFTVMFIKTISLC